MKNTDFIKNYWAVLPNGEKIKRKSHRTYKYVVVTQNGYLSWCGNRELAEIQKKRWIKHFPDVKIIECWWL